VRKRFAIGLVAAVIVLGLVVARRHEFLRFAIQEGARLASGYAVRIADLRMGGDGTALFGVRVERNGEPIFAAQRIVIHYSLHDLLPGSRHRFGLLGVELAGVKLTLTRFSDGSFNLNLPRAVTSAARPERVNSVPLRFWLRLRDAAIELREPGAFDPSAKDLRVTGLRGDAIVDTAALTRYRVDGAFVEGRGEPFTIVGRIDAIRGFAIHHAQARYFPLRSLANYFADTPAVRILGGTALNFDARLYALDVTPNVAPNYHVSLRLDVDRGRLALNALAAPIEAIHARMEVIDNAFFVSGARATLAGIPLHITGGVYDFSGALTGSAQLRLGVSGEGDLSQLREAFTFTRDQPLSGRVRLGVLVHGPVDNPVIVASADAAQLRYRAMPFDTLDAGVVYHDNIVALAPLRAWYGGIQLGVRGTMEIGSRIRSRFAVHVSGPANHLPYLDEMLGSEPIVVDAAAVGNDFLFHLIGSAASGRGVERVAAMVEMNPNGTARVAPFWFHTERGSLDGAYLLDRPHDTSAFWVLARNLRMRAPKYGVFPGLTLPPMPPVNGKTVGMTIAGGGSGPKVVLAGTVSATDASIANVDFDRVEAAFGGTLQHSAVNLLNASGPWGSFRGHGEFSSQRFVAYGNYRGTFEGLQPFLGSSIPGHGKVGGTAAVAVEPERIIVQGSNLTMQGATLRGVPIDRANLTLAIEGNRLRIYSADARAAGGDIVAAGTFSLAAPGAASASPDALALIANRLDAVKLHGIGLPLGAGTLSATGNLAAGAPLPSFDGGVTVAGGRISNFSIAGNGSIHLFGDAVGLTHTLGALGGTYAQVDGSIGALSSGSPAYALDAKVPAGQIVPTLRAFGLPNYMMDGTFNARLHLAGHSLLPSISGQVGVPAGDLNGLPFVDGSALLSADPRGVSIHRGAVLVGTTATQFTAVARPHQNAVQVSAPHADLSDFNNFFDTGDTLDGDGSVKLAAATHGAAIASSGNINVKGFRYRNLPIGDTRAVWSSSRNVIAGALAVGGSEGMLRARGSIGLSKGGAWQSTLAHSRFDLGGALDDLNLSLWIPALGMQGLPITGRASGEMTLHGRFPLLDVRGSARVSQGTLGPLTLDSAQLALHGTGRRVVIDSAEMQTPELSASAAGTLGLGANEPLDVHVHAATDHLAQLVYDISRVKIPVSGSFESSLQIGGSYKTPTFLAGFDATGVKAYGIPITSLFGEARLQGRALVISDAGATFERGEATLAGSLPLTLAPLQMAPPDQPVNFDLDVVDLDPSIFNQVLGSNTKLGGHIDGHIGLSGTMRQPVILGRVSLENGSYVSDLQRIPITRIAAALSFNHTSAAIGPAFAMFGSGSVRGSGNVNFPSGFSGGGSSLVAVAVARGAQFDFPQYGSGTIDARVALTKRPDAEALLSGNVALSNASLPFAAFVRAAQQPGSGSATAPRLPLAFDLRATAGKNVRVRGSGYGAGLDIGTTGSVRLGGSLAAPKLTGSFESTGGTLTYFDRAFRVQQGSVHFNAADGVLPTLHAIATSNVVNPDPDRARNPYGSAQISIAVDGPIQGIKVSLSSNPAGYSQDQILGLIAPFGGFVNAIGFSRQAMLARQEPSGITPLGALSPIPNVGLAQNSTITVGQEAFNILNAQFTAGLLAPVETTLGQGLGLTSVNFTLGYYGNVGLTATRLLGKSVSAVYAVTFGLPQVQSFGLVLQPNPVTSATLNFFYQGGPTKLLQLPSSPVGYSVGYLTGQPLVGNSGFSLTFQRFFW
jgi:TamB, inner membrane protein subunit of TAM complex